MRIPALVIAVLLAAPPLVADPPTEAEVRSAIGDLVDDRPLVREAARRTIFAWVERDTEALDKLLPRGSDIAELDAALREIRALLEAAPTIRRRAVRALAAAGMDAPLLTATRGLLDRLKDPAFLAPALASPTQLPATDGVLTPYVLGQYDTGKPGVCRVMEALLTDDSVGVRRIAARILYYHGSPANERALVAALADTDPYIRGGVALTLSRYGVRTACEAIRALLKDPEPTVRRHAAMALEELGATLDDAQIDEMLASKDPGVRTTGVRAIVARGAAAGLDRLAPLLDDPDAGVRDQVVSAMSSLGGFEWDAVEARRRAAKEWWERRRRGGD